MSEERGRPSIYTPELAMKICEQLAEGRSLRDVCDDEGMPGETTVRRWALEDYNGFSAQYAKARELGYHCMADELLEIADDGTNDWVERQGNNPGYEANGEHIQRSRLRVDTRKWFLSKVLPKVYGDKTAIVGGGPDDPPVKIGGALELIASRIAGIAARSGSHGGTDGPDGTAGR